MNTNKHLLKKFYTCLQEKDYAGISACYAPDATFSDPVFTHLKGHQIAAMWQMLLEQGKDLKIKYGDLDAKYSVGEAKWEATYTFSGRKVHNVIHSKFVFRDGLILDQKDSFSLWRWTRMALGLQGILLGWSPPVKKKVRDMAQERLKAFMQRQAA